MEDTIEKIAKDNPELVKLAIAEAIRGMISKEELTVILREEIRNVVRDSISASEIEIKIKKKGIKEQLDPFDENKPRINYAKIVLETFKEIQSDKTIDTKRGVYINDLKPRLIAKGMEEKVIMDTLAILSQAGEMYSPSTDYYRMSTR